MRFYLSGKAQEFTCNVFLLQRHGRQRIHLQRKQQSIFPTGNVWYFFHSAMSKGQKLWGQNWSIPQRYSSRNVLWANMAMTCVFVTHVLNVLGVILSIPKIIDKSSSDMDFYRLPSKWQVIFIWLKAFLFHQRALFLIFVLQKAATRKEVISYSSVRIIPSVVLPAK